MFPDLDVADRARLAGVARLLVAALAAVVVLAVVPSAWAVDPNLRGQWHLDETAGSGTSTTTPDSSGAGGTGALTAVPTLVAGRFGQALAGGGTPGTWVGVSRPPAGSWGLEPDHVSLTAWIKRAGFPGTLKYVAAKGDFPGCAGSSYGMYTGYPGRAGLTFYILAPGQFGQFSPLLDSTSSVWDGAWHAVTGTWDGSTARLYLDGTEVGSGLPAAGPIQYAGPARDAFTIGTYADKSAGSPCGSSDWPGQIDEVRVHGEALTATQVAALHAAGATTPPDLGAPVPVTPPTPVTPITPIALLPERNLVLPEIQQRRLANDKAQYSCSNGEWDGLAPDPKFQRLIYERQLGVTGGAKTPDKFVYGGTGVILAATSTRRLYYCVVKAQTASGATITAVGPTRVVPDFRAGAPIVSKPLYVGDLRIRGIDVLQLVQPTSGAGQYAFDGVPQAGLAFAAMCGGGTPTGLALPACANTGAAAQQARYDGVLIDADKPASAVVYLDRKADALLAHTDGEIQVRLHATAGTRLNVSLIQNVRAIDLQTSPSDAVTATERGDERFGVRFDLPQAWLVAAANGTFDLEATAKIVGSADLRQCGSTLIAVLNPDAACATNDTFKLTGVFSRVLSFAAIIRTIGLTTTSQTLSSLKSPTTTLQGAQDVLPGGEHFRISPFVARVPIDPKAATNAKNCPAPAGAETAAQTSFRLRNCAMAHVTNAVRAWVASGPSTTVDASPTDGFHVLVALHNYQYQPGATEPGASFNTQGVGFWGRTSNQPYLQINDGTIARPLTSAAHEFVHAMGAPHAGKNLGGIVAADLSCGGDTNGQVGEVWPPDGTGRLQGVRFDARTGAREVDGDDDAVPTTQQPLFDLMSYCGRENNAWISARTWNRAFKFMVEAESVAPTAFQVPIRKASAAQAASSGLVPTVRGAGFVVGMVDAAGARITGLEPADPDHRVPAGDTASSLRVRGLAADGRTLGEVGARVTTDTEAGTVTFIAPVPAGAAAVELVSGGAVVDRRAKGRPPVVALAAPRRAGVRVRKALTIRYRASDPDDGALTATIAFSPDGRRKWRTVLRGPATGRAVLPAQLLRTATAGRVRVRVSDGFDVAEVTSPGLRIDGRPPTATIVRPQSGERVQAAAPVVLLGQGADESGRPLKSRTLTWYAGARRLGTGERLRARLPAGRVTLRLVAQDATGRRTTTTRTVRVTPVALEVRTLQAGAVKAGARKVLVKVATNVPAILRGGGVSAPVGPRALQVRLTLPAKPAVGILRVSLRLTPVGGGPALRQTVLVLRG
jgi:Concanavalin A-like lectin/glucanases superfamily